MSPTPRRPAPDPVGARPQPWPRAQSRGRWRGALGLALAGALLLLGCGLPQPFRHTAYAPDNNPLVTLRSGVGVTLPPVAGVPAPTDWLVAQAVADRLRREAIPAHAVAEGTPFAGGQVLRGDVRGERSPPPDPAAPGETAPAVAGAGTMAVTLHWTLIGDDGVVIADTTDHVTIPAALWRDPGPSLADRLAAQGATSVIALLDADADPGPALPRQVAGAGDGKAGPEDDAEGEGEGEGEGKGEDPGPAGAGPAAEAAAAPAPPSASSSGLPPARAPSDLIMAPPEVTRAPGDGVSALEAALSRILALNGVRLEEAAGATVHARLRGAVEVLPGETPGRETVSIVWEVLDGSGTSLGTVNQRNDLPRGTLDGPWGDTAYLIAEGAAQGMGEILVRKGVLTGP